MTVPCDLGQIRNDRAIGGFDVQAEREFVLATRRLYRSCCSFKQTMSIRARANQPILPLGYQPRLNMSGNLQRRYVWGKRTRLESLATCARERSRRLLEASTAAANEKQRLEMIKRARQELAKAAEYERRVNALSTS